MPKFKVGDKVVVVGGSYCYTTIGSYGTVLSVDKCYTKRGRCFIRFDHLTGGVCSSREFPIHLKNLDFMGEHVPYEDEEI
jgi:ribosomal protein L24